MLALPLNKCHSRDGSAKRVLLLQLLLLLLRYQKWEQKTGGISLFCSQNFIRLRPQRLEERETY